MEFKTIIKNKQNQDIQVLMTPIESELDFQGKKIKDARAYCFYGDKFGCLS